jgi:GTP cyclohydrolase II
MNDRAIYGTLLTVADRRLDTVHGELTVHVFENLVDRRPVLVLSCGDPTSDEPLLARVHSSCMTSEGYGGQDCDCAEQLRRALGALAEAGRGLLFYLMQEGRGAGFAAKARDRMLVQASGHRVTTFEAYEQMGLGRDLRRYDEVGFACRLLGIGAPLRLLTNNPDKVAALRAAGVAVEETRPLPGRPSPYNLHYVESKRREGHALGGPEGLDAAELPEPVEGFEPHAAGDDPTLVRVASYLLPISVDGAAVAWFRVHVWFDADAAAERVLLTHGDFARRTPLVCVHEEDLFDRFPLTRTGPSKRRWQAVIRRIVAHGAGCALFVHAEGVGEASGDVRGPAALIARHLPGRRARPILDRVGSNALCDALLAEGIALERRVLLDDT